MAARTARTTKSATTTVVEPEMTQEQAAELLLNSPLGAALKLLIGGGTIAQEPVATGKAKASTPAPAVDPVKAFLEGKGLGFANGGRVYFTDAIIEAAARVTKTGKPEIVTTTESQRVAGLLIAKDDKGRVYSQNVRTL